MEWIIISVGPISVIAIVGFCMWGNKCNDRTNKERRELIDAIYKVPNWPDMKRMLDDVSYNEHMWQLVTFRNPWELYKERAEKFGYWRKPAN